MDQNVVSGVGWKNLGTSKWAVRIYSFQKFQIQPFNSSASLITSSPSFLTSHAQILSHHV
jgi:hypothetical protein